MAVLAMMLHAAPAPAVEFNINAIDADVRGNINLAAFAQAGNIAPGDYLLDVTLNGEPLPDRYLLRWRMVPNNPVPQLCVPPSLAGMLGLQPQILHALPLRDGCVAFDSRPEITFTLDQANQRLVVRIPQAWLAYNPRDWTPPSHWDPGVSGVLLDYNLFASRTHSHDTGVSRSLSGYGTAGINLGAWRLRSDLQYSADSSEEGGTSQDFSQPQLYLYRPLPSLGARLTLGQSTLRSDIFDGFSFTGATLQTDERMLPYNLRGYAPQVSGLAKTNAHVIVSQNGRVLYRTDVAPGPFVIRDLSDAIQGTLDVRVEEEDGQVNTFKVEAASVPFLTRQGQVRYSLAGGRVDEQGGDTWVKPAFTSAEFSWGAFSQTSLYGGLLLSDSDYRAASVGVGQNMTWLGAISFDITQSQAQLPHRAAQRGNSYRINYNKRFAGSQSEVSLAGYRHASRDFMSMQDFTRGGPEPGETEKETFSLTFSQMIQPLSLSLLLSLRNQTYWEGSSSNTYSATLGRSFNIGRFRNISASLSLNRTEDEEGKADRQIYLTVSVPLSETGRLGYTLQQDDGVDNTLTYSSTPNPNTNWSLSAGDQADGNGVLTRANYQHRSALGELSLAGSYKREDYNSLSAGWSGSFTATRHGAALHRNSTADAPRLMVDGDGVAGIPINGGVAVTNRFGVAVIPSLSSYLPTEAQVDVNHLPDGVDVRNNVIRQTLTEGAIGYRSLKAVKGRYATAVITLQNGAYPPLGSEVVDEASGVSAGMVSEQGQVYLQGVNPGHRYRLRWGEAGCSLTLPETFSGEGMLLLPCR